MNLALLNSTTFWETNNAIEGTLTMFFTVLRLFPKKEEQIRFDSITVATFQRGRVADGFGKECWCSAAFLRSAISY